MRRKYSKSLTNLSRTILIFLGLVSGDWRREDKENKLTVFLIEPLVESLLQVRSLAKTRIIRE